MSDALDDITRTVCCRVLNQAADKGNRPMRRNWLALVLMVSLVANGVLFAMLMTQRDGEAVAAGPTAELLEPTAVTATSLATATVRPRPAVIQATRVVPSPTPVPTETAVPTLLPAEASPTETPLPSPTASPAPTQTPEPAASPTLEAVGTDWLQYLNIFRDEANLPSLLEDTTWSLDSEKHSRYMTYTGILSHNEDPASVYYSQGGQAAAENGNIAAGFIGSDPYQWAINYWMSAPFHAIPILDPQLVKTGFAEYRDAAGIQPLSATLDVGRGIGLLPAGVTFPIMFPRDGGRTWVLRYSLPEFPEALSTCPGYQQPTGAPIILQIGDGSQVPQVIGSALQKDGVYLAHCRFDETTFSHPNEFRQRSARTILDQRDAIVIIPQQPLTPDSTYSVRVDVNGQTYSWSFQTAAGP